jgi:ribosome-associated protein
MEKFEKQFMKFREYKIPEKEVEFEFARSSGPGGQNVNRRETKVIAHWNIGASQSFNEEKKKKIRETLGKRVNEKDELVVRVQEERSQHQNRQIAIERLNNLVNSALIPQKERIPTKPTKASVERRLEEKKKRGKKKKMREKIRI